MNGSVSGLEAGGTLLEKPEAEALLHDGGAEYSLRLGCPSCWISVDSLSVRLKRDEGRLVYDGVLMLPSKN